LYLSDRDIRGVLADLAISTAHPDHEFDPGEQIQPCSIDLRLSNVVWKRRKSHWLRRLLRRGPSVDLRKSHVEEMDPRREWRKVELADGEFLTIWPGQVLMTRIYERFRIPDEYAGKIEGRSSYARIGLSIHCTGDFINPGWDGFMPMQLFNASPFPIKILPYLPICQLMIIRLSSLPERTYGDEALASKYVNDDGGPSYWWRDRNVKALHAQLGSANIPTGIQNEIVDLVRFEDPELLERFESFVARKRLGQVENADTLLDDFAKKEGRRRWWDRAAGFPFALGFAISAGLLATGFEWWHVVVWAGTAVSSLGALYAVNHRDAAYLNFRELAALRARNRDSAIS
jgi:deoxycytidine triphosphate deaminase